MLIYICLIIVLIIVVIYFQYLVGQKEILLENYVPNTVVDSYGKYKQFIENEIDRNNSLEERLRSNDYGQMYDTQLTNFQNLLEETKDISQTIEKRSEGLREKAGDFNRMIDRDRNYITNQKEKIIKKYKDNIDVSFEDPKGNVSRALKNVVSRNINPMLKDYIKEIPKNDKIIDGVNSEYSKGIEYTRGKLKGMTIGINQNIDGVVKKAIDQKIRSLPPVDLSKSPGVLVRMYEANSANAVGALTREYIVPSINYYMTQADQPLLSSGDNQLNKVGPNRYLEFIGTIKIPQDIKKISFSVESGSGARFYFGSQLQIDNYDNNQRARISNSKTIDVVSSEKIPFKLQTYEGSTSTNTFIILKWKLNDTGNFIAIPNEYYFLPDLTA